MGRKARKRLGEELRTETAGAREREAGLFRDVRQQAGGFLRGEYTPEVEATRTVFDSLRDAARNRLARTGNRAGYGALQSELGRQEARQVSETTRRGRLIGFDALRGLQAGQQGYLANIYGQRGQLAAVPGFWDQFAQAGIGAAGQAAGAYLGRPQGG